MDLKYCKNTPNWQRILLWLFNYNPEKKESVKLESGETNKINPLMKITESYWYSLFKSFKNYNSAGIEDESEKVNKYLLNNTFKIGDKKIDVRNYGFTLENPTQEELNDEDDEGDEAEDEDEGKGEGSVKNK
jgi:hypothetical protein